MPERKTMKQFNFFIEQLSNHAWQVGWREGHDDYGRIPSTSSGFESYADAEKFALETMRSIMRKYRDFIKQTPNIP